MVTKNAYIPKYKSFLLFVKKIFWKLF